MYLSIDFESKLKGFYTTIGHDNASAIGTLVLQGGTRPIRNEEHLDKNLTAVSTFLGQVAEAASANESGRRRSFRAHIPLYCDMHPAYSMVLFTIDLDFRKLEKSWEENIAQAKLKATKLHPRSAAQVIGWYEDVRQALRTKMSAREGFGTDQGYKGVEQPQAGRS